MHNEHSDREASQSSSETEVKIGSAEASGQLKALRIERLAFVSKWPKTGELPRSYGCSWSAAAFGMLSLINGP